MDESAPASAAPDEDAAPAEKPRRERWRLRVPTSVLVTLLVAALSVWVAPALTRQWDDRQKARELKAGTADEIAALTAATLAAGVNVARSQSAAVRTDRYADAVADWQLATFRMTMKLTAYFGSGTAREWGEFSRNSRVFLKICDLASRDNGPRTDEFPGRWMRPERHKQIRWYLRTSPIIDEDLPAYMRRFADPETATDYAIDLTSDRPADREYGLQALTAHMLLRAERVTAAVFAAHPAGLSTTRRDFLRDLLP